MADSQIEYGYGSISASQLKGELEAFVVEYRAGGTARQEVQAAGLENIEGVAEGISFDEEGAALDPVTATIIVAFAPAIKHIAVTFWDQILLPRLRKRYGVDVVGPEKRRRS